MLRYPLKYYAAIEGYQRPYMEHLVRELMLDNTESVLEIGCRRGYLSFQMALCAGHVEAIDFSAENIAYCKAVQMKRHCDNICFSHRDWVEMVSEDRIPKYDVVVTSHIHQFTDIERILCTAGKRAYILAPTQESLHNLVYRNLYEGLLSEEIVIESDIHPEEDYGQSFLKLYYFGIDPNVKILENGIRVESSCIEELTAEMMELLPVAPEKREQFCERMEKHTSETNGRAVLEMKQKMALLSWETSSRLNL